MRKGKSKGIRSVYITAAAVIIAAIITGIISLGGSLSAPIEQNSGANSTSVVNTGNGDVTISTNK